MTITSKFAGKCRRCGCFIPAGERIEWSRDGGATHLTPEACETARRQAAAVQVARVAAGQPERPVLSMKPVVEFLERAQASGKKYPKARFIAADGKSELRLSIAGAQSKAPGSVQVVLFPADAPRVARPRYAWDDGDAPRTDIWLGRIEPDGSVVGRLAQDEPTLAILRAIVADPAKAAAEYGRLTSRCSFCDTRLTDDRDGASVEMGYGKRCAERYGLPWQPKGTTKKLLPIPAQSLTDVAAALAALGEAK